MWKDTKVFSIGDAELYRNLKQGYSKILIILLSPKDDFQPKGRDSPTCSSTFI